MNAHSFEPIRLAEPVGQSAPPGSHSVQKEKQKAKEERILSAAIGVFARKGYHGSSIADIAGEAKVATGTIYLYFDHKEDLLTTLFRRNLGEYIRERKPALAAESPGLDQLRRLVALHLAFFEKDMNLARVFQIHMREVNPVLRDGIRPTMLEYFEMIDGVVSAGIAKGVFRSDLEVPVARQLFFGTLDEVVTAWVVKEGKYPLSAAGDQVFPMIARAFGADPGS